MFFAQDLAFVDKLSRLYLTKESLMALGLYKAFGEKNFQTLKRLIDNETNPSAARKLLFNILKDISSNKELEIFSKIFGSYLKNPSFEEIRFYYLYRTNNLKDFKGEKASLNALKDALLYYDGNDYLSAVKAIEPFKNNFPRFYLLLLIESGRYLDAISFTELYPGGDGYYFKALALYFMKNYNKASELLLNRKLDYKEKILLIDSMTRDGNYNLPTFDEELANINFSDDEFFIFKNLNELEQYADRDLKEKIEIFRIRWEIKNYINYLNLYVDEIKIFQERLKKMEKDLEKINKNYEIVYDALRDDNRLKEIKFRVININEMYQKLKGFRSDIKEIDKSYFTLINEEYEKAKKELKDVYQKINSRYKDEIKRINVEIYARKLEKTIFDLQNPEQPDVVNLLKALSDLKKDINLKDFSFQESLSYYQIYLLNELILMSANKPYEERTALIKEAIVLADDYLKSFSERKAEVMLFLADAYESIGDNDKALMVLEMYLKDYPEGDFRTYMKIAEFLFDKKQYDKAITFYKRAAEKNRAYRDAAYYKIGWSYYLSGRYDNVINIFLNYRFEEKSQRQELLLNEMIELLSRAFYKLDNIKLVEDYLDKNRQFPYPDKVFKYLGDIYLYLANYEKAIEVYKRGWERYYLYKNSFEIYLSVIDAYNFMGNSELAYNERVKYINSYSRNSKYFEKFKEFPREFGDEIMVTALYFNVRFDRTGDDISFNLATELYERLIAYFPNHKRSGEAAFMLAQLYEQKNNNKKAANFFKLARALNFNSEESFYRAIFCEYKMWKNQEIFSKELISSLDEFINSFKNSSRYNDVALLLADISLKEGFTGRLISAIDALVNNNDVGLLKGLDFCEANFDSISDKLYLSNIFDRGFKRFKEQKYLNLKHFSLFKHAKLLEEEKNYPLAINVYRDILRDPESSFSEFAIFNLSLLLQKEGKTEEAISLMSKIKGKDDLKIKAKEFIYRFGKEKGMYLESAFAAIDYANLSPENKTVFLLEAANLFIKGNSMDNAERVLLKIEGLNLSENEKSEKNILKGIIAYRKGRNDLAYNLLMKEIEKNIPKDLEEDFEKAVNDILMKTIYTKPEDEARESLEQYVGYLSRKYKESLDDIYLYKLGEIMKELSLFFLQQDEAMSRAYSLLRRALKNSVEKENRALIVKSIEKLREIDPKRYNRTMKLEKINFDISETKNYESLYK